MSTGAAEPGARGPVSGGWRWLAWPLLALLAGVYGALAALRRTAYRRGWQRAARAACPVISVGNLTAGGSGKTPVVDWLLGAALRAGRHPAALSRGYRNRSASDVIRVRTTDWMTAPASQNAGPDPAALGDEPAMLARRHPDLPIYVARRRALAAHVAALWDAPDLVVLDDGFQHLALARDLDVVLIDAALGLGNGRLLPLGPLREPLRAARRAQVVLITRAAPGTAADLRARVSTALGPAVPVFTCALEPARLRRLDGADEKSPEVLHGQEVRAFCGIARPAGFVRTLEALGARVASLQVHADHFAYPDDTVADLDAALAGDPAAAEAPCWVTTEKDAVKLTGRLQHADRLWVLELEVRPEPAAEAFFFDFMRHAGVP